MSQVDEFKKAYSAGQQSVRGKRWPVLVAFVTVGLANGVRYYYKHDTFDMLLWPSLFI